MELQINKTMKTMQKQFHIFNITAKKYMVMSAEKTKCMVISKKPRRCKLEVEGKRQVNKAATVGDNLEKQINVQRKQDKSI